MKKMKLGLIVMAFATSAMAGCSGLGWSEPETDESKFARQTIEKSLLEEEGYQPGSLRSASSLAGYIHRDCFTMLKTPDNGHLYEGCVETNVNDQTMLVQPVRDLGTRIATLAKPEALSKPKP